MMSRDRITQFGQGSIGKATHEGIGDIVAGGKFASDPELRSTALENLLLAIDALRNHLDDHDQAEVNKAVEQLRPDSTAVELRQPLGKIAGIATVVGDVGVPVINAIKELLSLFSSS
ncbi:hypothetical protein GCM10009677_37350 [Sphaerisporangium rubeum]|uniref:Uncharacterized protein n=1 Tax=Sphaerisporangium rubeum TaxID=321317 RepID=A0A7X0M839_9ACTN|nr:hypothetical protein [Sphaerisporangium rubeum]MBB6475205.1 hypothetical protein [Sphaerisporangium rubeum]